MDGIHLLGEWYGCLARTPEFTSAEALRKACLEATFEAGRTVVGERFRSRCQEVEVHDSVPFGRLFRLDGHFMTSERDEFFYHENLVHMAALPHAGPARALIVGGGDGGSAEELLKYPSMDAVTLCE